MFYFHLSITRLLVNIVYVNPRLKNARVSLVALVSIYVGSKMESYHVNERM